MPLLFNILSRFVIDFLSKEQASFNFVAIVTVPSDFGAQENSLSLFPFFPHLFLMKWWDWIPWSLFLECWVLSQLFHSPLSPSSRGSLVPLHFLPFKWYHLQIWDCWYILGVPDGSVGKESACNAGDTDLISGSGRSSEGGNGNPFQYSCLKNSMDREA